MDALRLFSIQKGVSMGKDLRGKELGTGLCQRPDGTYRARFTSISGKRPEKTFDKLSDAKAWLNDQRYLDSHGDISQTNSIIVDTWFEYWLDQIKKPVLRDSTYDMYKGRYIFRIKPYIGGMLLTDVKQLHCQNIVNKSLETDKSGGTAIVINVLSSMFQSAVENELIPKSPCKVVAKKRKRTPRVLTEADQNYFVEYMQGKKYGDMLLFVLETGLRCGELVGLKWEDIDFEKKCINIKRTLLCRNHGFEEHPPKTSNGSRMIPLSSKAIEILKERKKRKVVSQYVFVYEDGSNIANTNLNSYLRWHCKKMGIERISMHSLRHTFATRCIERGMRPKTLQKIMGHATLSMTMDLYVHATEDSLFEEMNKLEKWGSGGESPKSEAVEAL